MRIVIVYFSLTGNTEEIASIIETTLSAGDNEVLSTNVYKEFDSRMLDEADLVFFGTSTWGAKGEMPKHMRDVLRQIIKEEQRKLPAVAVFGSGEQQWGKNYCRAADETEYHLSKVTQVLGKLKIEQAPRGRQRQRVIDYVNHIMEVYENATTESKDI